VTTNAHKHFTTLPEGGGKCLPLPMPAGAHAYNVFGGTLNFTQL